MREIDKLVVLLPCYSLEDFQLDRSDEDAEQLLAAWTGLFHPVLIARAGAVPSWDRANDPPVGIERAVIVLADCATADLSPTWLADHSTEQNLILRKYGDLQGLIEALRQAWSEPWEEVDPEMLADFFALGYAYLQVELLTRQLRYMSNLDEVRFREQTVKAAQAALAGDNEQAGVHLQQSFDLLSEAREYFYPVESHLIDLTLVADTTLGSSLRRELECGRTNLLITADLLARLLNDEPETAEYLRSAVADQKCSLVTGSRGEPPFPLMPASAVADQLIEGVRSVESLLRQRPTIFGRRRFGLTALMPALLTDAGFTSTLHFALDDGTFPTGNQSKIRWEGVDNSNIAALARVPFDASRPREFLRLAHTLGQAMDLDHASTAVFAHWPGMASRWYDLLRRTGRYSPVLGSFLTLDKYFQATQYIGPRTQHAVTEYRSPYLKQAAENQQVDPVSRWDDYYRCRLRLEAARALVTMAATIDLRWDDRCHTLCRDIGEALQRLDGALDEATFPPEDLRDRADALHQHAAAMLAEAICPGGTGTATAQQQSAQAILFPNPLSFTRKIPCDISALSHSPGKPDGTPARADSADKADTRVAVAEVPAMGFTLLDASSPLSEPPEKANRPRPGLLGRLFRRAQDGAMADGRAVRNEFFQLQLDERSGGIQGVYPLPEGRNLLGQQLAMRHPQRRQSKDFEEDDPERHYTQMVAEEIRVTEAGPPFGELEAEGRLVDHMGEMVARFRQRVRVYRNEPLARLSIDLEPERLPEGNPWSNYYALRLAWRDEGADLYRCLGGTKVGGDSVRLESPQFVHLRGSRHAITLLCGGLPYHRKIGVRRLDTLLITPGERRRHFELALGFHLRYPVQTSLGYLLGSDGVPLSTRPETSSGWFYHIDSQNVIAAGWEPIVEEGRFAGARARLLETEGKRGKVKLQSCRPMKRAVRVNGWGEATAELPIEGEAVVIDVKPHSWQRVELYF